MVKVAYVVWLKDKQNLTSYVQLQHLADVMLEVLLMLDSLLQSNTNRGNVGDHAAKHWAGLVDSYYFSRWNIFFQYVTTNVFNGSPVNQSAFEGARITLDATWNYEWVPFQLNLVVTPSLLPKNWSPNMQMFQHQVTTRAH